MKTEEGYFSSYDGTEIFYRSWGEGADNALIIIHGYGDHSGRYIDFVEKLAKKLSFTYFAFDLRGQGQSKGARIYAESFDDYLKDVTAFLEFLKHRGSIQDKHSLFLFGHSLGGLIAYKTLLKGRNKWRAAIFSSPCFELYGIAWSPVLRFLVRQLNRIAPRMVMSNLVKPRFLFHDQNQMKEYMKDGLIERRVTAHLANLIVEECLRSQHEENQIETPIYVLASGNDRVVSLNATKKWFNCLKAPSKSIKIYPDLYHEIFNETHTNEPIEDLIHIFKKSERVL